MADSTSVLDSLTPVTPTDGMIASGLSKAAKAQPGSVPTMHVRPEPEATTSTLDSLAPVKPTDSMLLAVGKQPSTEGPGQGQSAGILSNIAAGANTAIGGPVDLMTGALNMIPRGINAVAGTQIPTIDNPVGGSKWINQHFGTADVQPTNEAERMAQGVGGAVASVPMMGLGAAGAASRLSGVPGSIANAVRSSSGTSLPSAAAISGVAGAGAATGQAASDAAPDWAKPYADLAGNLAGAGGIVGAAQGLRSGAGLIARKAGEAGIGSKIDLNGVRATQSQAGAVGGKLSSAIGPEGQQTIERSLSAEAQAKDLEQKLADPKLDPADRAAAQKQIQDLQGRRVNLVPGSQPTTAQVAQTPGATDLENAARVHDGAPFSERAQQQNNARVASIQGLEPNQGNPASVGQLFTQHLDALESRGQAAIGGQTVGVQGQTDALGGQAPTAQYGGQMRDMLTAAEAPEHTAASALFQAVDPAGTWAIQSAPLKGIGKQLAEEVSPTAQTDGQVNALMARTQSLPPVIKFSDLSQIRADANDGLKRLMRTGSAPAEVRRLTILKNGIDQTISQSIDDRMQVDPGLATQIRGIVEQSSSAGDIGARSAGAPGGRASAPGQSPGNEGQANPGRGLPSGGGALASAPTTIRKPESLVDWLVSKGGVQDPGGDLHSMGADTIHHQKGGRLINRRGMRLDDATSAAQQEGFLQQDTGRGPNEVGTNQLIDAIGEHISGRPTYRGGDVADVEAYRQGQVATADKAEFEDRLYNARDEVNVWAEQAGVPLTASERDHAAHLAALGAHPEDAIRQATTANEDRILGINAQRSAFGRLGLPASAEQGELKASPLTPNVGGAEASSYYRAVQAWKDLKEKFGQGGVGAVLKQNDQGFRVPEGNVPAKIFTGSPTEPAEVERFITAAGGPDKAADIGRNVLANDLRNKGIVKPDGTVDAGKLAAWRRNRAPTLAQFPGLDKQFASVESAQRSLDDVAAAHKEALRDFNRSAAAKFINADPNVAVRSALSSPNPTETFTQLAQAVRGNPAAEDGLKRAVVDHIVQQHSSAVPSSDGMDMLKAAQFRSWVGKNKGPLRALFGGQGIQNIEMVAADLRRQAQGPQAVAGSQTASHQARSLRTAVGAVAHHAPTTALTVLGEIIGEHLGHGLIGAVALPSLGMAVHALRQAGIKTMTDLTREAMLHPELARALMQRADSAKAISAMTQRRIAGALQGAILADTIGEQRQ